MLAAVDTLDLAPANDLLLRDYLERAAHSLVNAFED
jgi:hemoglobin